MVTIILGSGGSPDQYIYTIKPGGAPPGDCDYTTLNNWESGTRSNLVTQNRINIAEVYSGNNSITGSLVISTGWTTDTTHYVEIHAATGHEHTGVWSTSKAYAYAASGLIFSNNKDLRLGKMQFKWDDDGAQFFLSQGTSAWAAHVDVDRCIFIQDNPSGDYSRGLTLGSEWWSGDCTIRNSILLINHGKRLLTNTTPRQGNHRIYNCTFSVNPAVGSSWSTPYLPIDSTGCLVTEENNYYNVNSVSTWPSVYGYFGPSSQVVKGTHTATSNTEAVTANLRNIPYSTATFQNITVDSENLRPVVSGSNKLLDNGANLTGSGVTTDIIGTARPLFGGFDIGAFENDIPICWNYTARYKNSNKLFKASGCGNFPKSLQVPSNVDTSTGKMVDDGIFISPDKYKIV